MMIVFSQAILLNIKGQKGYVKGWRRIPHWPHWILMVGRQKWIIEGNNECVMTGNNIKYKGTKRVCEVLKKNTTLTSLNLGREEEIKVRGKCKWNMWAVIEWQTMRLDLKEKKQWVKCSKWTLHWHHWIWVVNIKGKSEIKREIMIIIYRELDWSWRSTSIE